MNNLKLGVLVSGVVGLIGCFLPFISGGGESISFWGMKELAGSGQIFVTMAGYVLGAVMGAMAVAKPPMQRWQAIVATLGFAFVGFKMRDGFLKLITDGAIGAKLMAIAVLAGLVFSVLCIAKPEATK
ncbi:MAG: hypothetical protein JWO36_2884 [Myxococcales bacterium]|nr:hypothetical protein [Myxococcales bacterium]